MGSAFAAPKRRDTAAWRTLSVLLHAGVRFGKSCCGGPGYRPRTLREVRERMAYARAGGEPFDRVLVRRDLQGAPGPAPHGLMSVPSGQPVPRGML